jgi:putative ABC transport system permease protein
MFGNNFKTALRNLRKNKLFATINILGLAIGLIVYVFGGLLVEYEQTHDVFFDKADRTYTIGSYAGEALDVGIDSINAAHSAVGPIVRSELADVELVARSIRREFLLTMGEDGYYQDIRFADPELLQVFNFNYLHGDSSSLDDPSGILLTEEVAIKFFGRTDVLGEVITFDNEFDFHVSAVIENVPLNSHFNSMVVLDTRLEVIAPVKALVRMVDFDEAGGWRNLSMGNMTYVVLPETLDGEWLNDQLDSIYTRMVPDDTKQIIAGFFSIPLPHANLSIWDTIGMPVIPVISLLSLLVLIVACVNYTNLATAQSLGRSREVGMRKTMGASRGQLLFQFLVESMTISAIAMVVAVAALEIIIPLFNNMANKALALNYLQTLPWLAATTVMVGLLAGSYPAWLISRSSPIDALRDTARKGKKGSRVRSVMIAAQFAISAFMLALVSVVFMQNELVKEGSYIFPRSEVYTIQRLYPESIQERLDTLRHELESLPGVATVAYSSQVPFEQNNSGFEAAAQPSDEAGKFMMYQMDMTPEFFAAYDIPLLAGRNLSRDMANDRRNEDSETVNVVVNELALTQLGFDSAAQAIGQRFYDQNEENALRELIIVGVVPTQGIRGVYNKTKPWTFIYGSSTYTASVRIASDDYQQVISDVENVWKRVIPEYPMQGRFLDDVFNDVFNILRYMNWALAGFATVALVLALIGLFGLAAFMAAQRTREIGVRKVLGASSAQIARLLIWQFSKPVMFALLLALPAAWFATDTYLNFFANRIDTTFIILLISGFAAVLLAWSTVAGHAWRISRSNPILALRYE